jgi:hypothetical protein
LLLVAILFPPLFEMKLALSREEESQCTFQGGNVRNGCRRRTGETKQRECQWSWRERCPSEVISGRPLPGYNKKRMAPSDKALDCPVSPAWKILPHLPQACVVPLVIRAVMANEMPEGFRVIHFGYVAKLVNHDVIHQFWRQKQ